MSIRLLQISIPQDVVMRKIEDQSVVIDLKTEKAYKLDEIGTSIWISLEASKNVGKALDKLQAEFDVSDEDLEADVAELIDQLVQQGLLSRDST